MNKTKIYQIIRRLTDGMLPESGRRIVVRWLRGQEHVAETDEAMFRIWNEIDGAQVSDEETKVALQAVKRRIGLSERRIGWKQILWKYAAIILLPLITYGAQNEMYHNGMKWNGCNSLIGKRLRQK